MPNVPIIANLCNSAKTPEEEKADEFLFLMEKLHDYVDAFEINVSCPNQC
jgi:dihydroorotate dehydrogenase